MIILATIERYLITVKSPNLNWWRQHRGGLALGMLGIALILRGTEIFEYTFTRNGNCTELAEFEPALTDLVNDYVYGTLFRFYLRNIFTVFVPFFLLGYLNLNILKIRSATRLLVLVVFSYLIANVLNVLITAWEYVDFKSTQTEVAFEIYEVLTDVISVLYVFTCASRLFIYLLCNQEIRSAFYESLCPQGLILLRNEPQNEYKPPQIDKIAVSLQRSQLGTEFDRLAIAIVSPRISNASSTQHHLKIRSATRLLVLVVFSYLIANVLNVLITAWEYVDFKSTQTEVAFEIYEVLTDVISVLYVFTCASRLFIYLLCNQEIRSAFYESLCPQGLILLRNEPQNEYKPPQVDKIAVSLQRSQLGTEFDRLAIAIVSPRISNASSTQHHVTELLLKESRKHHHHHQQQRNGNYHSIENSIIIENPLADMDDENIPFCDD
uniref:Gustatory receptor n=1 Tax=Panagrolaimus sp. ES5 TaxID=591445 RepID=A0AC34FPP9_9BILA